MKRMNTRSITNCYASLFLLCPEETQAFNELFEEDEDLNNTVEHCAEFWRNKLRYEFPEHITCRQRFIIRTISQMSNCQSGRPMTTALCRAIAFAVTDLVERRVTELDAQQIRWLCN